jgi:hypothetical protein
LSQRGLSRHDTANKGVATFSFRKTRHRRGSIQASTLGHAGRGTQIATFAAGCFWGMEACFREIEGVRATRVGYTGGTTSDPDYRQVCAGDTGHAEAVEVAFDPRKVSYAQLLDAFWGVHNPTTATARAGTSAASARSRSRCPIAPPRSARRTDWSRGPHQVSPSPT